MLQGLVEEAGRRSVGRAHQVGELWCGVVHKLGMHSGATEDEIDVRLDHPPELSILSNRCQLCSR
jgi:hypothetical protein